MAFFRTGVSRSTPVQVELNTTQVGSSRVIVVEGEELLQLWDGKKWVFRGELPAGEEGEWQKE